MNKRKIFIIFIFLIPLLNYAQESRTYSTEIVRRAVEKMIPQTIDSLGYGNSILSFGDRIIVVRKSNGDRIEHIGMPLFSEEMRKQKPMPVYDYLEYALLDKTFHLSDNKLLYDDIIFRTGGWNNLLSIKESDECNVSIVDDKAYILKWTRNGKAIVEMLVPIHYTNLGNVSRNEMEQNFIRALSVFYQDKPADLQVDEKKLTKIKDGEYTFFMLKGTSYINKSITDNTYYGIDDTGKIIAIVDKRLPIQSIANMVMLNATGVPDADLDITFILTEGKKEKREVSLRQFIDFARSQGCSVYYGYEQTHGNIVNSVLFLYNQLSGYDHVLTLKADKETLGSENMKFTSNAYLYIPTNNVKQKYGQIFGK